MVRKNSDSGGTRKPFKSRKTKKIIVFDEDKRKDYLTGFSKRKKERQRKAQQQLIEQWKEEKKKVREELRDRQRKREKHDASLLEDVLKVLPASELHISDSHRVTVTELDPMRLLEQRAGSALHTEQSNEEETPEDDVLRVKQLKSKLASLSDVSSMQKSKRMRSIAAQITSSGKGKGKRKKKKKRNRSKKR